MNNKLYHVTLSRNIPSIIRLGLDPRFSQGKRPLLWLVEQDRLHYAIAHVTKRHNTPILDVVPIVVYVNTLMLKKTAWRGIYTYPEVILVAHQSVLDVSTVVDNPDFEA